MALATGVVLATPIAKHRRLAPGRSVACNSECVKPVSQSLCQTAALNANLTCDLADRHESQFLVGVLSAIQGRLCGIDRTSLTHDVRRRAPAGHGRFHRDRVADASCVLPATLVQARLDASYWIRRLRSHFGRRLKPNTDFVQEETTP